MELMSGNEAIAQGAWEAGAHIGVAYPGTPSTETLEAFAKMDGVYAEWCVNEKVAVEVGVGASAAGAPRPPPPAGGGRVSRGPPRGGRRFGGLQPERSLPRRRAVF